MAHHRRKRSRTKRKGNSVHWLSTPGWWNIEHHSRPRRQDTHRLEKKIIQGVVDESEALWPLDKKPHIYYW